MPTREASVETYLRDRVRGAGGLCVKLNPAGYVGIPDRLVVLPGGRVLFIEVKKPKGGVVGKLQYVWRDRLREMGMEHRFVLTRDDVDDIIGQGDRT
jgi:hypothetical protein